MSKPIVPGDTWYWRTYVTVLSVVGTVVDVASLRSNERASTITDELLREGHYIRSAVGQCREWHASQVELVRRVAPEGQKRWLITELEEDHGCPSGWLAVASATPKEGTRDVIRGCASSMTRWLMPAPAAVKAAEENKRLRLLSPQLDDALRTAGKAAAAAAQKVVLAASRVRPDEPTPPAPAADTCHFCGGPNEGPIPSLPCPRCFAAREAASEGLHLPAAIERAIASLPPDDELLPPLRSIHDTLRAALDIGRSGRVQHLDVVFDRARIGLAIATEAAVSSPRQRYEARYASRLQIAAVAASAALGAGIVAPRPAPPPKPPAPTPALIVCDHGWNDDDSGIDW